MLNKVAKTPVEKPQSFLPEESEDRVQSNHKHWKVGRRGILEKKKTEKESLEFCV